jgi:hypothetical protein
MSKRGSADDAPSPVPRRNEAWHGRDESAAWLQALGLQSLTRWHVEIEMHAGPVTSFQLHVYSEEWGYAFHHAARSSWIRITDIAFVHGLDEHRLLATVPELISLPVYLRELEREHRFELARSRAKIRTNIDDAAGAVRRWLLGTRLRG